MKISHFYFSTFLFLLMLIGCQHENNKTMFEPSDELISALEMQFGVIISING